MEEGVGLWDSSPSTWTWEGLWDIYHLNFSRMYVYSMCLTLCDPMDCNPQVHGIIPARILEWVAISCSRGSS